MPSPRRTCCGVLGTAPARQQTSEPIRLQGALGLVEGRPGDAERRGGLADCNAVDPVTPHHLVAHLDQVLGVEEWMAGRARIQRRRKNRTRSPSSVVSRGWKVVHRLYPDQFDAAVPNPWLGVTKHRRVMATKKAATRNQVYAFAKAAIEAGHPEAAGAAVICFEWL